jgi:hypothetical protein
MRKIITVAAIIGIAAVAVVWSKSLSGLGKGIEVEATEASAAISPTDIMVRNGKNLPVGRWEPAY